jgi:uncharacterized protein (DUF885 family)
MRKLLILLTIAICLSAFGCDKRENPASTPHHFLFNNFFGAGSKQLNKLFEDELEFNLREDPLFATFYGDHRFDDKLPQTSQADIDRRAKQTAVFLGRLAAINRNKLSDDDKTNYDIFKQQTENGIKWNQLQSYLMPISHIGGFYTHFAQLADDLTFNTVKDYENYISRMNAFTLYTQQHIELMREGIKKGMVPPKIILEHIPKTIESLIAEDINDSKLFEPFKKYPPMFGAAEKQRVTLAGLAAIKESVRPAYRQLLKFIKEEYIPAGRAEISISSLPNGKEYYRQCIRYHTTLDLTPEQIHQTGLAEVKRIRQEMTDIVRKCGFKGDLAGFKKFLQKDKRFHVDTPEQLLKEVAYILKRTDGQLPKYFSRLPRMPVGLRKVPPYIEAKAPTAYYSGPTMDKTKAGFFYVNTYHVKDRSLYNLTATALHETNPGHHLQIALQQEMENLPPFRRLAGFTAYSEGWALYAEQLGEEMGIYEDDYSRFGGLDTEMWRACRLVVDTGIHWFGWSRQQAIDFMLENTSLNKENIIVEVDRYIVWPGQALSYKIGEMKIMELRRLAEKKLGQDFDIRQFHDVILNSGSVPLDILEENVNNWLATKTRCKTAE